jgi:hypothetical protein
MPNITVAGTYTKASTGFNFLSGTQNQSGAPNDQVLLFAGTSLGTSVAVQYIDDQGVARTFKDGDITFLPTSLRIGPLEVDLQIVAVGSPNFNVTPGFSY